MRQIISQYTLEPPSTRYQGSKRKLLSWIEEQLVSLEFSSALDAFGGTASVSYLLKALGKRVTYNDTLAWNCLVGRALIENSGARLSTRTLDSLCESADQGYEGVVTRNFSGIYFTDEENLWIDAMVSSIRALSDERERAIAWYALFQSCICKRPYNLFHRKNLYVRLSEVKRGFGNKKTWDTPFEIHFRKFVAEANAAVFDNGHLNQAHCGDALEASTDHDLVYIDPPYMSSRGVSVDYHGFYHFLEGLACYDEWEPLIDRSSRHLRLHAQNSPWNDRSRVHEAFNSVFDKFRSSILVVSYRSDGIPSIDELHSLLRRHKKNVRIERRRNYKYVLSTQESDEVLFVAS